MASLEYLRPYLDTSVYLAAVNAEEGRVDTAREIFDAAERGVIQVVASTLVAAEVIRMKGQGTYLPDEKEHVIDAVFDSGRITWVEMDLPLALEARRLARLHHLHVPDAIHLASALRGHADVLLRWDPRFQARFLIDELNVCDPYWWGEPTLPLG
ncbi:MAG TPA: PIN domain-containing protein [Verrucomicrobiae bacterium]|nr:PIN domain-containing protein [Verrucomicrobiae bacterium]